MAHSQGVGRIELPLSESMQEMPVQSRICWLLSETADAFRLTATAPSIAPADENVQHVPPCVVGNASPELRSWHHARVAMAFLTCPWYLTEDTAWCSRQSSESGNSRGGAATKRLIEGGNEAGAR